MSDYHGPACGCDECLGRGKPLPSLDLSSFIPDSRLMCERSLEEQAAFLKYCLRGEPVFTIQARVKGEWHDGLRCVHLDHTGIEARCGCGEDLTFIYPGEHGTHVRGCPMCGLVYRTVVM